MSNGQATWTRLHKLAQHARQAGATQRLLEVELSPGESAALADVLEAALCMTTAIMGRSELGLDEPSDEELAHLAMQGGAFDWLAEEPDLYSDEGLQDPFG